MKCQSRYLRPCICKHAVFTVFHGDCKLWRNVNRRGLTLCKWLLIIPNNVLFENLFFSQCNVSFIPKKSDNKNSYNRPFSFNCYYMCIYMVVLIFLCKTLFLKGQSLQLHIQGMCVCSAISDSFNHGL